MVSLFVDYNVYIVGLKCKFIDTKIFYPLLILITVINIQIKFKIIKGLILFILQKVYSIFLLVSNFHTHIYYMGLKYFIL